jgi:hypothetical protein
MIFETHANGEKYQLHISIPRSGTALALWLHSGDKRCSCADMQMSGRYESTEELAKILEELMELADRVAKCAHLWSASSSSQFISVCDSCGARAHKCFIEIGPHMQGTKGCTYPILDDTRSDSLVRAS